MESFKVIFDGQEKQRNGDTYIGLKFKMYSILVDCSDRLNSCYVLSLKHFEEKVISSLV